MQTASITLSGDVRDGLHSAQAETRTDAPKELAELRAFVGAFPAGRHRFAFEKRSWGEGASTVYHWRAYCLPQAALFGGTQHIGRIRDRDGVSDQEVYRVGFSSDAIAGIHALPQEARRLAILHDDDVLVVLSVDHMKTFKSMSVPLVKLTP